MIYMLLLSSGPRRSMQPPQVESGQVCPGLGDDLTEALRSAGPHVTVMSRCRLRSSVIVTRRHAAPPLCWFFQGLALKCCNSETHVETFCIKMHKKFWTLQITTYISAFIAA